MKSLKSPLFLALAAVLTTAAVTVQAQASDQISDQISDQMPTLNQIKEATLAAPYSCGAGYKLAGLFVSQYSRSQRVPDLLYNGACGATDYVQTNLSGDDMGLISDLGDVPLEEVTPSKAFNFQRVVGHDNNFKETQPVLPRHTYVVLVSRKDLRALFVFKVVSHTQDGPMTIRYAVKSYSLQRTTSASDGFYWGALNQNAPRCTTETQQP